MPLQLLPLDPSERQKLHASKTVIFDHAGNLLWRSPAWADTRDDRHLLGHAYLEFIFEADQAPLLAWFLDPAAGPIVFRAIAPETGRAVRVSYAKVACGIYWIVVGEVTLLSDDETRAEFPNLPCNFGL